MFPLKDLNPTTTRPFLVYALVALNALVFLATAMDLEAAARSFGAVAVHFTGGFDPSELHSVVERLPNGRISEVLLGPSDYPVIPREDTFWTRALTHMFIHGGFLHLAGNMLFLWVFGDNIEEAFGKAGFLCVYFGAGLVALVAQVVAEPRFGGPMVGASGAVAGVLGAYLKLFPRAKVIGLVPLGFFFFTVRWSAKVFLGLWIAMQILSVVTTPQGVGGGVAWWAHIGGFGFGYLAALALVATGRFEVQRASYEDIESGRQDRRRFVERGFRDHGDPDLPKSEGPYGTYGGLGRGQSQKIRLRDLFRRQR